MAIDRQLGTPPIMRIKESTATRVHYVYRRAHALLRREGWKDNYKPVYRIYRLIGLSLRHRRPKRNKAAYLRQPKRQASHERDMEHGFRGRCAVGRPSATALPAVDNYTSECLAIDVARGLKGEDVVRVLEELRMTRGPPKTIKVDNGSEFISKEMDKWAYEQGVELDFPPGKPTDNANVESFNDRFREECLRTPTGSCRWRTAWEKPRRGGSTTIRIVPTPRRGG